MDLLSYQRIIFGYHGCDQRVAEDVLLGRSALTASENSYDWLGSGIYFWEHGPARALEWAHQQSQQKRSKIKKPAVLGAVIQLGNCFDLLDVRFTVELARFAHILSTELTSRGQALPTNQTTRTGDYDWLKRHRDCFVLNSTIPAVEASWECDFDSVRGVFQEGQPAFDGAGIKLKSHIQIAIRDPRAIIGYFHPHAH